ncbi:MAG TPA: sulfotransferase [Frankiaceae bacterium]|nr:sulfotransferase [Frankiaceae bacterium]
MPQLTVERVEEYAAAHTQATDPQPKHFRDNLAAVVECLNEGTEWTDAGLYAATHMMGQALRNRIEVDRYVSEVPAVDEGALVRPIFLTGLPRSGTTYFQYLFDQDPSLRMLRTWEGDRPVPPPATDPGSVATRREASIEGARQARKAMGGDAIDSMHLTDVDGPQECLAILDQTFVNPGLLWTRSAGSYLTFLLEEADLAAAYEYHQRVLRLLQFGASPRRWALKWPCHLLALEAIRSVYPDASFVVTHRDPVQALASNCSLAHMLRSSADPAADPHQTGRDMLELVRRHVDRLVEFDVSQSAQGRDLLVHVDYYRLVDDPVAVMTGVFDAIGIEWTETVDERIRSWRSENPQGKRGVHRYTLEEYGLEADAVADAFSSYTQRFDVPSEYDR